MSSNRSAYDSINGLCNQYNELWHESELISRLQDILQANPNVVHEKNHVGRTLLHKAACRRSPEFCQALVSLNQDLVKTADNEGTLPFHFACEVANMKTTKYLYFSRCFRMLYATTQQTIKAKQQ